MQDLTVDEIIASHDRTIAREGGDSRVLSEANLLQVVFQANLVADPVVRAATVLFSLVAYPSFREGNEKTAMDIALQVLAAGGWEIDPADTASLEELSRAVTSFEADVPEVEAWFVSHARKKL
jgi:prophage maintenance system killer protein